MIALFVATIGALLIFIGLFGDILRQVTNQGILRSVINLDFIFKTGWQDVNEMLYTGKCTEACATFSRFTIVIQMISFIIAFLGVLIVVLKSLIKFIINMILS